MSKRPDPNCPDCKGVGSYGYTRALEINGEEYRGESIPDILLICPCTWDKEPANGSS